MGGEQYAVLMFGPKDAYCIEEWITKLGIIDKKEWVRDFLQTGDHTYTEPYDSEDTEGIDIVFQQECDRQVLFDKFLTFLEERGLCCVFDNNVCWDTPMIGVEVMDYRSFTMEQRVHVMSFCKQYSLSQPTFYAGISGEFE